MRRFPLLLLMFPACDLAPVPLDFGGENQAPVVAVLSPADGVLVLAGAPVHLQASVSDPDANRDLADVQVASSLSGRLDPGDIRPDSQSLIDLDLSLVEGIHQITVTATDKAGLSTSATVSVQVGGFDPAPVVTVVAPTEGQSAYQGQRVPLRAEVTDARYDAAELDWRWSASTQAGAQVVELGAGVVYPDDTVQPIWFPPATGTWVLTLVVTNPDGLSGTVDRTMAIADASTVDLDDDGQTPAGGDCDDNDADAWTGAPELPNGADDDCDGVRDEGTPRFDNDGDGYCGDPGACTDPRQLPGDCDDTTRFVSPLMREICLNDVDDDCDGTQDPEDAIGCVEYWTDVDHDGWGTVAQGSRCLCAPDGDWSASDQPDCAPSDPEVYPFAPELPNDADDDCDGQVDEDTDRVDLDGDGYCANTTSCARLSWKPGDCDDTNVRVYPGAKEDCGTVYDDNCNGQLDEVGARGCTIRWADRDLDGWGAGADYACVCQSVVPYTAVSPYTNDCDDSDARAFPGQQVYQDSPTRGNGDYDFNCNSVVERSEPNVGYVCTFDLTSFFCRVTVEGFVGGTPDCGVTRAWANDCSAGLFDCSAAGGVDRTMKCR